MQMTVDKEQRIFVGEELLCVGFSRNLTQLGKYLPPKL
jgi:hypothetical protein